MNRVSILVVVSGIAAAIFTAGVFSAAIIVAVWGGLYIQGMVGGGWVVRLAATVGISILALLAIISTGMLAESRLRANREGNDA